GGRGDRAYRVIGGLEAWGGHRWAGPFPVGDKRLAAAFDRVAGRLERTGVAGDARAAAGARGLRRFASLARGRNKPAVSERAAAAARAGAAGGAAPARGGRVLSPPRPGPP